MAEPMDLSDRALWADAELLVRLKGGDARTVTAVAALARAVRDATRAELDGVTDDLRALLLAPEETP